jgi:hypothetical protein
MHRCVRKVAVCVVAVQAASGCSEPPVSPNSMRTADASPYERGGAPDVANGSTAQSTRRVTHTADGYTMVSYEAGEAVALRHKWALEMGARGDSALLVSERREDAARRAWTLRRRAAVESGAIGALTSSAPSWIGTPASGGSISSSTQASVWASQAWNRLPWEGGGSASLTWQGYGNWNRPGTTVGYSQVRVVCTDPMSVPGSCAGEAYSSIEGSSSITGTIPCGSQIGVSTNHSAWETGGASITHISQGGGAGPRCRPRSVRVSISPNPISRGSTAQASGTAYSEDNYDATSECGAVQWSSANGSIASIESSGQITGNGIGGVLISAACGSYSDATGPGWIDVECPSSGGNASRVGALMDDPCAPPPSGGGGGDGGDPTSGYWLKICTTTYYGYYVPSEDRYYITSVSRSCSYQWQAATLQSANVAGSSDTTRATRPGEVLLVASGEMSGSAVRLERYSTGDTPNVIVIDTTRATPGQLAATIAAYQAQFSTDMRVPAGGFRTEVTSFVPSEKWTTEVRGHYSALLSALKLQPVKAVSSYGSRRTLSLTVPRAQVREEKQ